MAALVIPKVWSPGEVPTAADVNAVFAAIVASVNNIANAQIAPNANIAGTKIAPLATANFEDEAITTPKLAVGAATVAQSLDEAAGASTAIVDTETVIVSKATSRTGGGLLVIGTCVAEVVGNGSLAEVRARLLEDGAPIGVGQTIPMVLSSGLNFAVQLKVAKVFPPAVDPAVVWGLGVTRTAGTATITATGWQLVVWELR